MIGRRPRGSPLPPGRYFATLGEIAENYGGMTNVVLHRSRAFAVEAGVPVEILTFGPERDYRRLTKQMIADGRLVRGVQFRNMWSDLEGLTTRQIHAWPGDPVSPELFRPLSAKTTTRTKHGEGVATRLYRNSDDGTVLQIDYLRRNGRLLLSDRRDLDTPGRQSLTLCAPSGQPMRSFASLEDLRTAWLDDVIGQDPAYLFSDSFGVAAFTHTYKRPNVIVIQTFHNRHLAASTADESPYGMTQDRYLGFLRNIDDFDATIFLSRRQRQDVDALFGPSPQRYVMPNSRDVATTEAATPPDRHRGSILARLVPNKQLDHAARAVAAVNAKATTPVSVDIYGEGHDRPRLETLIHELGLEDHFLLHGYDPAARTAFTRTSFSLLTSSTEGFPLVLVESMAAGCIPIAYDVRYGPREIITDGVDGFLVSRGDVTAVAERITRLMTMSDTDLARMRAAARHRAEQLSDASVTAEWGRLLHRLRHTKRPPAPLTVTVDEVTATTVDDGALRLSFTVRPSRPLVDARPYVELSGRGKPALTRALGEGAARPDGSWDVTVTMRRELYEWLPTGLADLFCDIYDAQGRGTTRLPAPVGLNGTGPMRVDDGLTMYATRYGNLSLKRTGIA